MNKEEVVILATGFIVLSIAVLKLAIGYLYRVPALIADGYHGLADAVIDLGGFFIIRASRSEALSGTRLRYLFSFVISEFLIVTGILIALERLEEVPTKSIIPFITTIIAALIIFGASLWRHRVGEEINSPVLKAEAMHGYSDVASTFGAMIGSLAAFYGAILSTIGVLIVVAVMIFAGIHIAIDSVKFLVEYIPRDVRDIVKKCLPEGLKLGGIHVEQEGEKTVLYVIIEGVIHPAEIEEIENYMRKRLPNYEVRIIARPAKGVKAIAVDENGNPSRFGEAYAFILIEGKNRRKIKNPFREDPKHRGVKAMRYLMELGVTEVCAKDFGEGVESVFSKLIRFKRASRIEEC